MGTAISNMNYLPLTASLNGVNRQPSKGQKHIVEANNLICRAQIKELKLCPFTKNLSQICAVISCYKRHSEKLTVHLQMI